MALVVVELVDEEQVGVRALHDLGDRAGLGVVRGRQVLDKVPLVEPVERGVERGHPDRLLLGGPGGLGRTGGR